MVKDIPHERLENAGLGSAMHTTPDDKQTFVDMSTPEHTARVPRVNNPNHHFRPMHVSNSKLTSIRGQPHQAKSSFVGQSDMMTMHSTTTQFVGGQRQPDNKRRHRRANFDAMQRSSAVTERFSRLSRMSQAYNPSFGDPLMQTGNVPVLGECDVEQKYSIALSMDEDIRTMDAGKASDASMMRLHAMREVLGDIQDDYGRVDRATFSKAFEVNDSDFHGYDTKDGMINSNALLVDAVLELDVDAEEKLRFIFETLDAQGIGHISPDQVDELLSSNFASANLTVIGTDSSSVAKLLFRKAGAQDTMTYNQFKTVFHPYVERSLENNKYTTEERNPHVLPEAPKSKFASWYESNHIRFWWLLFYVLLNALTFYLKWRQYKVDPVMGYGLRIARGCAQVCMLNILLVLLPMCRSITQVLKKSQLAWRYIPFDDHIEFHKLAGSVLLISGLIHTFAHVSNEIHLYLIATPYEIAHSVFVERQVPFFMHGRPPFVDMLQALPVWSGVLLLIITLIAFPFAAIAKLRQGNFNKFWYTHMLFGPFTIIMAFHGGASWLATSSSYWWALPPFMIYLVERRFRYAKSFASPVRIMEARELDGTVAVFMECPARFEYRPGMYTFINVPAISSHEWHPFTISSSPKDEFLSLHIRMAGDWTNAFRRVIEDCHENRKPYPYVYLDGPVGAPTQDYHRYNTVICVAGGIGVTPFASILKDVCHLWEEHRCTSCGAANHPTSFKIKKLYFHWTTRAQEALGWFDETMAQITRMDQGDVIEAHQYLTTVKEGENASQLKLFQQFVHEQTGTDIVSGLASKQLTHFGRPNWDEVFEDAKQKHPGEEIGVFYCGPHVLEKVLDEMCKKHSSTSRRGTIFDFHSEKFS